MDYKNGPVKSAAIRGKDDDKKLFVGGLPKPCEEKDLRDEFSKYGEIESVHIKKDPVTQLSRGFCFIVFKDPSTVDKVLEQQDNVYVNGKKVDPKRVSKSTNPGKIFVGGLTSEFNEDKIKEHFGKYGTITQIEWPFDKQKNQKKAYCFISFENKDCVTDLLKKSKEKVGDKELDVKKVKYNPETQYGATWAAYGNGGRGAYAPAYGAYYPSYGYNKYGGAEYTGYDDYYQDPNYYYEDGYSAAGYEAYPTGYTQYPSRAPRGGRTAGNSRHHPYI